MNGQMARGRNHHQAVGEKFLSFALAAGRYGVPLLQIQEIVRVMKIVEIPRSPDFLKGVVNLRGKLVPVVDLRLKLGFSEAEYDAKTCIIILKIGTADDVCEVDLVVDTVLEVVTFTEESIQPVPDYGSQVNTEFVRGLGKLNDSSIVILLAVDELLHNDTAYLFGAESESADHVSH